MPAREERDVLGEGVGQVDEGGPRPGGPTHHQDLGGKFLRGSSSGLYIFFDQSLNIYVYLNFTL